MAVPDTQVIVGRFRLQFGIDQCPSIQWNRRPRHVVPRLRRQPQARSAHVLRRPLHNQFSQHQGEVGEGTTNSIHDGGTRDTITELIEGSL